MANDTILKEGFGHFEILDAICTDKEGMPLVSRSKGEPMIKLRLLVTDTNGNDATIYDHITSSVTWKLIQLQNALDIGSIFSGGKWNVSLLMYKSGACTIKTQEAQGGYEAKSVIGSYKSNDVVKMLQNAASPATTATKPAAASAPADKKVDWLDDSDDEIPF